MEQPINVWIVEDDRDWLRGLSAYLESMPDLCIGWTTSDPAEARQAFAANDQRPDVVLMDIMLDGRAEGIDLAEAAASLTGARVIMLTSMEEKDLIFRSFQAGAIDYQIKSEFESLPDTIRAAYRRQAAISPQAAEQMREEFRRLKKIEHEFEVKQVSDAITPAELQLLELVDQGHTQTEIADKLVVSIRTVKNHINHILKKLNLSGSKEAAQKVKELGLFQRSSEAQTEDKENPRR